MEVKATCSIAGSKTAELTIGEPVEKSQVRLIFHSHLSRHVNLPSYMLNYMR